MKAKTTAAVLALRNPKENLSTLTVEYRDPADKFKRISTGVQVVNKKNREGEYQFWDGKTIKAGGSSNPTADTKKVAAKLREVNEVIENLERRLKRWPLVAELTDALESAAAPIAPDLTVAAALEAHIEAKRATWQPASVKNIVTVLHNIEDYQLANKTEWVLASLTNADIESFENWLMETRNYKNSTLRKRIDKLKEFLKVMAESHSLAVNLDKVKHKYKASEHPPVTLSPTEIEALRTLDLTSSKRLEHVRDVFIAQTFTGLRYSDLIRLKRENIKNGFIKMQMKKVKKYTNIPVFPELTEILEKYKDENGGFTLPLVSEQKQNKYLKELCELVPVLDEKVLIQYSQRNEIIDEYKPKNQLITTHTARRTFITMCLELDTPAHVVMEWSGHRTFSAFQKYINAAQGQTAAATSFTAAYAKAVAK